MDIFFEWQKIHKPNKVYVPWSIVNKAGGFYFLVAQCFKWGRSLLTTRFKAFDWFFYSERLINRLPLIDNIVFWGKKKLYLKVSSKLFISREYIDIDFGSQVHFIDKSYVFPSTTYFQVTCPQFEPQPADLIKFYFYLFFLPLMKESKFNTILLSLTTPTASWQKNQNSAQFICSSRNNRAKDSKVTSLMELLFLWYVFWYNIAFSALSSIASIRRNIIFIYCLLKVHRVSLFRRIVKVVILMYWFIQPTYLIEKSLKLKHHHLEG